MEYIFLSALFIIFYTYLGYGILIALLNKLKGEQTQVPSFEENQLPEVTLIVPCFNEGDFLHQKIANTLELNYPKEKFEIIFVTDGTSDGSEKIPTAYPEVIATHSEARKGKLAAMKRAVGISTGEILIFCDANTILNQEAVMVMVQAFADQRVGAVTGEKYIITSEEDGASSKGEGIYWKYESWLKKMDSNYHTMVGGAGELMGYRKELFEFLPDDTLLDDFMLTMKIAEKGYLVKYVPEARASEYASASVGEEMKRKIRIAAGGWQSIFRLPKAINPFHDFTLTFQYVSHRVLRWTLTPMLLIVVFILNHLLVIQSENMLYEFLLIGQYAFYFLALLGHILRDKGVTLKGFYVPYYFYVMNYCALLGLNRWLKGRQQVTWERAKRANE
ncbi:MAG: glycosyltransferase family 2 protein [Mongoliitalea sp.]